MLVAAALLATGCSQPEAPPESAEAEPAPAEESVTVEMTAETEAEDPAVAEASDPKAEEVVLENGNKLIHERGADQIVTSYFTADGALAAREVLMLETAGDSVGDVKSAILYDGADEILKTKAFEYDAGGNLSTITHAKPDGAVWYVVEVAEDGQHKFMDGDGNELDQETLVAEGYFLDPFALPN